MRQISTQCRSESITSWSTRGWEELSAFSAAREIIVVPRLAGQEPVIRGVVDNREKLSVGPR